MIFLSHHKHYHKISARTKGAIFLLKYCTHFYLHEVSQHFNALSAPFVSTLSEFSQKNTVFASLNKSFDFAEPVSIYSFASKLIKNLKSSKKEKFKEILTQKLVP